jgi:hypothetical protein
MVNYIDPATGNEYQEVTTDSETLEDGTIVIHSTWIPITQSEKKVGRPSKK